MKKLIIPILIGVVMFATAFGGAFYYYSNREAWAAGAMKEVAEASLRDLQEQGRATAFSARLMAVLVAMPAGDEAGTAPRMALIPGVVHYDLDLRDMRAKDIVWDAESKSLRVTVPPLILSEPEFDRSGIRIYSGGGWAAPVDPVTVLDAGNSRSAQGQLLQQARDEAPMRLARDTARKVVERAFAARLKEEGKKAAIAVRFADEKNAG